MAEEMELDPQLKALLEKANLLKNPGDGDDVSYEQLRQQFDHAFGYATVSLGCSSYCLAACRLAC